MHPHAAILEPHVQRKLTGLRDQPRCLIRSVPLEIPFLDGGRLFPAAQNNRLRGIVFALESEPGDEKTNPADRKMRRLTSLATFRESGRKYYLNCRGAVLILALHHRTRASGADGSGSAESKKK